jgi:hypothetical protein
MHGESRHAGATAARPRRPALAVERAGEAELSRAPPHLLRQVRGERGPQNGLRPTAPAEERPRKRSHEFHQPVIQEGQAALDAEGHRILVLMLDQSRQVIEKEEVALVFL